MVLRWCYRWCYRCWWCCCCCCWCCYGDVIAGVDDVVVAVVELHFVQVNLHWCFFIHWSPLICFDLCRSLRAKRGTTKLRWSRWCYGDVIGVVIGVDVVAVANANANAVVELHFVQVNLHWCFFIHCSLLICFDLCRSLRVKRGATKLRWSRWCYGDVIGVVIGVDDVVVVVVELHFVQVNLHWWFWFTVPLWFALIFVGRHERSEARQSLGDQYGVRWCYRCWWCCCCCCWASLRSGQPTLMLFHSLFPFDLLWSL